MWYILNMKCSLTAVLLLFIITKSVSGQEPVTYLNAWREQNPIEKLYLHTDRETYFPGQQVWLKGYLLMDFLPSVKSSGMYVELLDDKQVINRQVFPAIGGLSRGQINLPDTLAEGLYTIRAYTLHMLNQEPGYLHKKLIRVINAGKSPPKNNPLAGNVVTINFFPEGGNLITGLNNTVAFKMTDQSGMPVNGKGRVFDSRDKAVAKFTSYHDGMGYFDLPVTEGLSYYAVQDGQENQKYPLPQQTKKGVVLRVFNVANGKQFEIQQTGADPDFKAAYMVGQMQHHIVFTKILQKEKDEHTGTLQTANLLSGVMQITVFNDKHQPLAERLTFIDNKEYRVPATLLAETVNNNSRQKNNWSINFPTSFTGNISVAVTDADFDTLTYRTSNIFSAFLLNADIKGYVHHPSWYFTNEGEMADNALDLVMMTNGWRRFRWEELSLKTTAPLRYQDPGFIQVKGLVNMGHTRKVFADKNFLLKIITADTAANMQMIKTDAKGEFVIDSMFFFGKAKLLFTDIKGRRGNDIKVKASGDSLMQVFALPAEKTPGLKYADDALFAEFFKTYQQQWGKTLADVTVKAKKKTTVEELESRYVSGLFAGDAIRKMNLLEETMYGYNNIFDYIQFRVPGVGVVLNEDSNEQQLFYRHNQNSTISSMGSEPMTLYLDEIETSASVLAGIQPSKIAYIKLFSSFVGASGAGGNGVLAFYTRKGDDALADMPLMGDELFYTGYTVIKDFYSPDYTVAKRDVASSDERITLYWNAGIPVDKKENKVPVTFFNNDKTKRFKIVVEGVSNEGRLVFIEKVIELNKKAF